LPPDFLKPVLPQLVKPSFPANPNLRFRFAIGIFAGLGPARRSVQSAIWFWRFCGLAAPLPNSSNRKEWAAAIRSCSFRPGFLGQFLFTTRAAPGKRARPPASRPSRHRRDQKTFSAGPRSFSFKELWFPEKSN
jgi:hypothetical protein